LITTVVLEPAVGVEWIRGCGVRGLYGLGFGGRDVDVVGEERSVSVERPLECFSVRIDQQLAGITTVSGSRIPRPVDAVAVALSRHHRGQVRVPHVAVGLLETNTSFGTVLGDQAQVHGLGDLGEQGEVGSCSVVGRSQWIRGSRPYGDGGRVVGGVVQHGSTLL
jgi:hypothetical protein